MTHGIYTKWIIGAAFGLLIVAAGCYWYYQHTTAPYKAEAEQAEKLLQQWEADKAKTPTTADKEVTQAPADSTTSTAEKPINKIGEGQKPKQNKRSLQPQHKPRQQKCEYPNSGSGPTQNYQPTFHGKIYSIHRITLKIQKIHIKTIQTMN